MSWGSMTPQTEKPGVPNWLKWLGLVCLGIGAGLVNVATDTGGHASALEVCKHVFFSLGLTLTGGAVKTS